MRDDGLLKMNRASHEHRIYPMMGKKSTFPKYPGWYLSKRIL